MKKVLIWSYHFPPEGGPGVQRISKLIKNFPLDKFQVFVLTAKRRVKVFDSSLLQDIEDKCKIIRVTDYYSYLLGDIKKWFSSFIIPDKSYLWAASAYHKAKRLQKIHNFDLIISTSPPHSSHIFANKFALKYGIKSIIEFRDEWTSNSLFDKAKKQEKQTEMEQYVLQNCDQVITISETAKSNFIQKNIPADKVKVIYNGYDEDDFKDIGNSPTINEDGLLRFGYMGRLNTLHSPRSFFKGLHLIQQESKEVNIHCKVIGDIENSKWVKKYPDLEKKVDFIGYMEHHACLEEISKSDVLLLLSTNSNKTEVVTGKVFEYFRLKKPIFAILSSKKELYNILIDYNNAYIAFDDDIDSIKTQLKLIYHDFINNNLNKQVDDSVVRKFDRKTLSESYLKIIESILK